jgi:hypothetical protein
METLDPVAAAAQKSFEEVLNRHGFGFQFSVLTECREASKTGWESRWRFVATEVPVEVRGAGTRIDFVLEHAVDGSGFSDVMICECKRVNPAFAQWCFIGAPFTRRNNSVETLRLESIHVPEHHSGLTPDTLSGGAKRPGEVFHMGFPVKIQNAKGDPNPKGNKDNKNDIEDAVTQVLRGLNGYIELVAKNRKLIGNNTMTFFPVVFTTAELWISSADLSSSDLMTGNIDLTKWGFEKVDWLWFQYNTSPGIKHSLSFHNWERLEELMANEFVRSVAIVNSAGIRDFLRVTTEEYLR